MKKIPMGIALLIVLSMFAIMAGLFRRIHSLKAIQVKLKTS